MSKIKMLSDTIISTDYQREGKRGFKKVELSTGGGVGEVVFNCQAQLSSTLFANTPMDNCVPLDSDLAELRRSVVINQDLVNVVN